MQWLNEIKARLFGQTRPENEGASNREDPKVIGNQKEIKKHLKQSATNSNSKREANNYTASFPGLVEVVEQDEKSAFLVKTDTGLEFQHQIKLKGKTFYPPPLDKIPLQVPSADELIDVYESEDSIPVEMADLQLYRDVRQYLKKASDLPSESHYDLTASWVLHTYLIEQFQYSPIIWLYGDPEKGKSRTGKAMIYSARRGMIVESLREAYLLRASGHLCASIFFDVINFSKKAAYAGSEDAIMQRFERGMKVPRVLYPEKGAFKDTAYFDIFGATIIGTNRELDYILQTRTLQITMQETERSFDNHITEESATQLRLRLLAFRARHLQEDIPEVPKPAKGRLGEITQPLLQIINLAAPERSESFLSLISEIEIARKSQKSQSLEGEVLQIVYSLQNEMQNGYLPVSRVTDSINKEKSERQKLSPRKIGSVLTSLGIERKRATKSGGAAIVWNVRQINLLMKKYGLEETSVSSESSVSGHVTANEPEGTEDSEDLNLPF